MFALFFTALAEEVLLDILRPKSTFNKLFFFYLLWFRGLSKIFSKGRFRK